MSETLSKSSGGRSRGVRSAPLSPRTSEGLLILTMLALAGMVAFSLLNLAGPFGRQLTRLLSSLLGWGTWVVPVYLFTVAALKLRGHERFRAATVGLTIMALTLLALVDLSRPLAVAIRSPLSGEGGGYVGLFLRYHLETLFSAYVTWFLLLALFLATVLIVFDTTLEKIFEPVQMSTLATARFARGLVSGLRRRTIVLTPPHAGDESPSGVGFVSRRLRDEREAGASAGRSGGEPPESPQSQQPPLPLSASDGAEAGLPSAASRYKPVHIEMPLSLLNSGSAKPRSGDIRAGKLVIQRTLESFGIPVEMGEVNVGPTVTQYTLKPDDGVKLSAITALSNDLALALAAHPIRIEAPIPGRSLVGIEVPNQAVAIVPLREILESDAFQKRRSNLLLALGQDVAGVPWVVDLERMPHLLVAGATGSGKSVALNVIILSLLYQNDPGDLKLLLVDPKRVEFPAYQHIPHLLTPVVTDISATVNALKWCLKEMDRRFNLLSDAGDRNIQSYNRQAPERLPYIVIVIDELADLMVAAAVEVEAAIIRLAQMARAVGMHLILATQRPSVDVITGLIKANVTARVAFAVASLMDSRTILDTGGAERLVGRGDMLFVSSEVTKPKRLQGAFVTDEEIRRVVDFLKAKAPPEYIAAVTERPTSGIRVGFEDEGDALLGEAEAMVVQAGKASASLLQRRLKVGYARAARLLDLLEAKGVVGPGDGAKPRDVLIASSERGMLKHDLGDGDVMEDLSDHNL